MIKPAVLGTMQLHRLSDAERRDALMYRPSQSPRRHTQCPKRKAEAASAQGNSLVRAVTWQLSFAAEFAAGCRATAGHGPLFPRDGSWHWGPAPASAAADYAEQPPTRGKPAPDHSSQATGPAG